MESNLTADDAQARAPAVDHQQAYVAPDSSRDSSGGHKQLVKYNYYAAGASQQRHDPDPDPAEPYMNCPELLFRAIKAEFWKDAQLMKKKMHRYPPSIQALGDWYTVPKFVAIGPYFHRRDHLQKAEKMKRVAVQYCIDRSSLSVQDMYAAVDSVAKEIYCHGLYDKDAMEGIGYEDEEFLPMMFHDACFLVTYILRKSGHAFDAYLFDFFVSNDNVIAHDIMLLENQIPLQVVDAVMRKCTSDPLKAKKDFIDSWQKDGILQEEAFREWLPVDGDQDYYNEAPHLLGLIRFYAVGEGRRSRKNQSLLQSITSVNNELAEIGISLAPNKTRELTDMGVGSSWIIFGELSMAPLCLSDARASWLVNMAALELCTTPDFFDTTAGVGYNDSAVCSYLHLLSTLIHREEDVHELRNKGILLGAGFSDKKTLDFFKSLHSLPEGPCYVDVLVDVQIYKNQRPWKMYRYLYHNWKYIVSFLATVSGFVGVMKTLMDIKARSH